MRRVTKAALLLLALTMAGCGATTSTSRTTTIKSAPQPTFAEVVARVRTGVIRIETTTCDGDFVGTGIVVGPRLVATVEHVIDGASTISLKRNGRVVGHGTVIGSDAARDVALVQSDRPISGYHFRFAARAPQLGEDVSAIGFPLGLPLTVTRGSVSGLDRAIPIDGINRRRLVQTDAAVNPGNSGGPLMTDQGLVVGLVDLGTEQANGLAFAVSADVAGPLISSWTAAPQPIPASSCATQTPSAQAAPAPPTTTTATAASPTYTSSDYTIGYPAGWTVGHIPEPGGNQDTSFTAPGDPTLLIRVDENPTGGTFTPTAAAAPVIASLRREAGYVELGISHETFAGLDALRWEFEVPENGVLLHKVDEFLGDPSTGHGWAILVQAPDSLWTQDESALESYANSFQVQ